MSQLLLVCCLFLFLLKTEPIYYMTKFHFCSRFMEMNRKWLDTFGLGSSFLFPDFDPFPLQMVEE